MNVVLNFKSFLLLLLCYQIHTTDSAHHESFEQHLDSQSQENDYDLDERDEYYGRPNANNNYAYEKESKIIRYSNDYDECNSCACNKCDDPPDCCKEVCNSCPQLSSQMSQFQMLQMPQMSQLPMPMSAQSPMTAPQDLQIPMQQMQLPQMQMPQIHMPRMQLPQMQVPQMQISQMQIPQVQIPSMQMSGMPTEERQFPAQFLGPYQDQNFIYFPLSSNFMNFFKNLAPSEPSKSKALQSSSTSTTITAAPTLSTTTVATTTTTSTITTPLPVKTTTKVQPKSQKLQSKVNLQSQPYSPISIDNKNMLESALRNALNAISNNVGKTSNKPNSRYNRYVLASALRRTKPVISTLNRYGILPIPNNMAESLLLQTRNAKGIRP